MKWVLPLAVLALAVPATAQAQGADKAAIAAQQAAMSKLVPMRGIWRGSAVTQLPDGSEHKLTQTERVGTSLDGTITVVEGRGYEADGSTSFHALGVISFEAATGKYWLTSNAQGRGGRFALTPTETGFIWEIPAGANMIRYTATITGGKWVEVGDFIAPGAPPRRFFRMELTRLGDTGWPEAGGVPMK